MGKLCPHVRQAGKKSGLLGERRILFDLLFTFYVNCHIIDFSISAESTGDKDVFSGIEKKLRKAGGREGNFLDDTSLTPAFLTLKCFKNAFFETHGPSPCQIRNGVSPGKVKFASIFVQG
jgi:hypothetical protein